MPLSVAVVEDDMKFRSAIAHVVMAARDMSLAGTADDLPSGRALIDQAAPDVLLVDLDLPSGSGLELIRYAARHCPECDVVVLTVFDDERHVMDSIAAGATGYLLKDTVDSRIAEQIRVLRSGGSPVSPAVARRLLQRLAADAPHQSAAAPKARPVPAARLSPQEQTVLSLSAKGHTYEEVARLMGVSSHSVLTYVKRSYRKLQVHTKTEAVYEARLGGLLRD